MAKNLASSMGYSMLQNLTASLKFKRVLFKLTAL